MTGYWKQHGHPISLCGHFVQTGGPEVSTTDEPPLAGPTHPGVLDPSPTAETQPIIGVSRTSTVKENSVRMQTSTHANGRAGTNCPKPQASSTKQVPSSESKADPVMSCVYLNARSIKCVTPKQNKIHDLKNLLLMSGANLVAITETWLNSDIGDNELLPPNYVVYRKDRDETCVNRRGGGVLIGIDNRYTSKRLYNLEPQCEILVCEIVSDRSPKIAIVLCYRPPCFDKMNFVQEINATLARVSMQYQHICMLGDFNFPNIDWSSVNNSNSSAEAMFVDLMDSYSLEQINSVPSNVHGSVLDLVFTNSSELYSSVCAYESVKDSEPIINTDHTILTFDVTIYPKRNKLGNRTVFNYKKANYAMIADRLEEQDLCDVVRNCNDINQAWNKWLLSVNKVIADLVPKVSVRNNNFPPWCDAEAIHFIKKKQKLWRRAKKCNRKRVWSKLRRLRRKVKSLLKTKYDLYIRSLGDNCVNNPKKFWSFFHAKSRGNSMPSTMRLDGRNLTDPLEKANGFNDYFSSVFSQGLSVPSSAIVSDDCANIYLNSKHVLAVLSKLDVNKAVGPDNISPYFLKQCRHILAPSLCIIFNKSLQYGKLPSAWKCANVTPVFKKGERHSIDNYRPISLLSVVSKVMERCIHDIIYPKVQDHIHELQHGFCKGKSCTSQLLQVYHEIGSVLDSGGRVDVAYLDFSRAFDSVSHSLLIKKLVTQYGFRGNLLKWLNDYLSNRKQRVIIDSVASDWKPVTSGVPQGSILGPLMFLLFINDMPLVTSSCTTALFADDAKCFKEIKSVNDCIKLQNDLTNLYKWSKDWGMSFNLNKCKILSITRSRINVNYSYVVNDTVLGHVGTFKDLGVVVDCKLNWSIHIQSIVSKTRKVCNLIKRSVGFTAPSIVKLQLYKGLCRSNLEYSSQLWSPHVIKDIKRIESVQRNMTKYIIGSHSHMDNLSYTDRCIKLELLPLSYRREIADLVHMFKYLCGMTNVTYSDVVQFSTPREGLRSASDPLCLTNNFARTENFKCSYFMRIVRLWNSLPFTIRSSVNVASFKDELTKLYFFKMRSYDVHNHCTLTSTCRCCECICST